MKSKSIFLILILCLGSRLYAQTPSQFEWWQQLADRNSQITDLTFDPTGNFVVGGYKNGQITVWETQTQKVILQLQAHTEKITDISFSPTGKMFVSASYDGTVKVWEFPSGKAVRTFRCASFRPYSGLKGNEPTFAVFPNAQKVYFGGYNLQVSEGTLSTGNTKTIYQLDGNSQQFYGITSGIYIPKEKNLAIGYGGILELINLKGKSIQKHGRHTTIQEMICEINYNPTQSILGVWKVGGQVTIYRPNHAPNSIQVTNQEGSSQFCFSPNGNALFSGNQANNTVFWQISPLSKVQVLDRHQGSVSCVDIHPTGTILATGGDNHIIKLWKVSPQKPSEKITFEEHELAVGETIDLKLQFQQSRDILLPQSKLKLDKLAQFLKRNPTVRIRLEGHTDNVGNEEANLQLSKNRAAKSKSYLVKRGIQTSRIETQGFGSSRPIADNSNPETRKLNRRVQMVILAI